MRMSFTWGRDFFKEFYEGCVHAHLSFIDGDRQRHRPEDLCGGEPIAISAGAENLLGVLEDICEGPAKSDIDLSPPDFLNVLAIMSREKPVGCVMRAEYYEESGKFELFPFAEMPFKPPTALSSTARRDSSGASRLTPRTALPASSRSPTSSRSRSRASTRRTRSSAAR